LQTQCDTPESRQCSLHGLVLPDGETGILSDSTFHHTQCGWKAFPGALLLLVLPHSNNGKTWRMQHVRRGKAHMPMRVAFKRILTCVATFLSAVSCLQSLIQVGEEYAYAFHLPILTISQWSMTATRVQSQA
jgi:hypothetical protein